MANRPQPGTTPHDTEKVADFDFASGRVGSVGDWTTVSITKLPEAPFREIDRFENVRKPRSRRHRRYFAFKFGAWSARTPSGSSSGSWKATSLRPIR
jgi:hypothetical protein